MTNDQGVLAAVLTLIVGWNSYITRRLDKHKDTESEHASRLVRIETDTKYIREAVDELRGKDNGSV